MAFPRASNTFGSEQEFKDFLNKAADRAETTADKDLISSLKRNFKRFKTKL